SLALAFLVGAGCASNDRVSQLEERLAKIEKATGDAGLVEEAQERLAAIERRQELARVQLARLEKWQRSVRLQPGKVDPAKPDAAKTPEIARVDPPVRQGSYFKSTFERALAADL